MTAPATADSTPTAILERISLVLDAFDGPGRLTLAQVVRRTGLPRSSAHRMLERLVEMRWLRREGRDYELGTRLMELGSIAVHQNRLHSAAAPILQDLHRATGYVVHLGVLDGSDVLYLDKVGGRFATGLPSRVGGRAPAHATGVGKAILAWLQPEEVDALLPVRLPRSTDRTIADLGTLRQELTRIRSRHGLAFERGEAAVGASCVAAALRGPDGPVAALSLCGEVRTAPLERVAPLVVDSAREISRSLFPSAEDTSRPARRSAPQPQPQQHTWSQETMLRLVSDSRAGGWI